MAKKTLKMIQEDYTKKLERVKTNANLENEKLRKKIQELEQKNQG